MLPSSWFPPRTGYPEASAESLSMPLLEGYRSDRDQAPRSRQWSMDVSGEIHKSRDSAI